MVKAGSKHMNMNLSPAGDAFKNAKYIETDSVTMPTVLIAFLHLLV